MQLCPEQGEQTIYTPITSKISKTNNSFIRHLYMNILVFFVFIYAFYSVGCYSFVSSFVPSPTFHSFSSFL